MAATWARAEMRFARAMHQCLTCQRWIDEEPYTRTIVTNDCGGLDVYINCADCCRLKVYAA